LQCFHEQYSKGTVTGSSGEFVLSDIPAGKFELIASSIGHETYVFPFSSNQLPLDLKISLKEKATDLSAVTVEPFLKDGWETWGRTFIENFIGTTDFASACSYPFFSDMPTASKVLQMEWRDNRKKVYLGSIMHFIRSLYSNEIKKPTIEFTGKLSVTYRRKRKFDKEVQRSVIYLLTPAPVEIEENGYYDSPLEMFMTGYWSKSQKLASILPLDYWPDE
jgi:hypothetical protein